MDENEPWKVSIRKRCGAANSEVCSKLSDSAVRSIVPSLGLGLGVKL